MGIMYSLLVIASCRPSSFDNFVIHKDAAYDIPQPFIINWLQQMHITFLKKWFISVVIGIFYYMLIRGNVVK